MPDLPPNVTQIIIALVALAGSGGLVNYLAGKRADRAPKPKPKATRAEVGDLEDRVNTRIDELEERLADTVQRLTNRTQQYNGIRAAWYALRDLVITWKGQVERHDATAPPMPAPLLDLLYNPLPVEDDPEVYDTKRRDEIRRLRELQLDPDIEDTVTRRRPKH